MASVLPHQFTEFRYRYRDSANFKADGAILLRGSISASERQEVLSKMEGGEFFVSEQIGIPPLYAELYQFSGGPTDGDHCWHEYIELLDLDSIKPDEKVWGSTADFMNAIRNVDTWNIEMSAHYGVCS